MARREREGGGGGCSDKAVAMLPRGDDTTRGVGAEGAAQGELEEDDSTRVGGQTTRGKLAVDDRTTQQEGGAHDVVGSGGNNGGVGGDSRVDAGNSSTGNGACVWGGLMTLTTRRWQSAATGGETATVGRPPIGLGGGQRRGDRCHGDDHRRDQC